MQLDDVVQKSALDLPFFVHLRQAARHLEHVFELLPRNRAAECIDIIPRSFGVLIEGRFGFLRLRQNVLAGLSKSNAGRKSQLIPGDGAEFGSPSRREMENVVPRTDNEQIITTAIDRVDIRKFRSNQVGDAA